MREYDVRAAKKSGLLPDYPHNQLGPATRLRFLKSLAICGSGTVTVPGYECASEAIREHPDRGAHMTSMHERVTRSSDSLRSVYVVAGISLLVMAVLAGYFNFGVFERLIIPGDGAGTISGIVQNIGLFRFAILAFVIVTILDVVVAWALYLVFESDRNLSLLAALARITYAATFIPTLNELMKVDRILAGGSISGATPADLESQVMTMTQAFASGWDIAHGLLGLHLVVLGAVILRTRLFPRFLGALVIVAGAGYAFDGMTAIVAPGFLVVSEFTFVGEALLIFWFLARAFGKRTESDPLGPKRTVVPAR
jgi:hypothetical protein